MMDVSLSELLQSPAPQEIIETLSFERAMALLQQLCDGIEGGNQELDSMVTSYEIGVKLADRMEKLLSQAELRVKELDASER